jgi:DNA polymerase-3 subunit epsilon
MGAYDWAVEAYFGKKPGPDAAAPADLAAPAVAVAQADARGPGQVFVAYDLETTGLYPDKDHIVEIGAVKFDRRGIIGRFSTLIDPGIPMPPDTTRINGITDGMLQGMPTLDEVLLDFLRFIQHTALIAHNANFDGSFVNAALKLRWDWARKQKKEDASQGSLLDGLGETDPLEAKGAQGITVTQTGNSPAWWAPPFALLPNRVVDTLLFSKEAFPGLPKYKMQDLAMFLKIQALDAHRAEDDARVCMELFIKCAERTFRKLS